jgi:hypothetical protein
MRPGGLKALKITVFLCMTPCSFAVWKQSFGRNCYLRIRGRRVDPAHLDSRCFENIHSHCQTIRRQNPGERCFSFSVRKTNSDTHTKQHVKFKCSHNAVTTLLDCSGKNKWTWNQAISNFSSLQFRCFSVFQTRNIFNAFIGHLYTMISSRILWLDKNTHPILYSLIPRPTSSRAFSKCLCLSLWYFYCLSTI